MATDNAGSPDEKPEYERHTPANRWEGPARVALGLAVGLPLLVLFLASQRFFGRDGPEWDGVVLLASILTGLAFACSLLGVRRAARTVESGVAVGRTLAISSILLIACVPLYLEAAKAVRAAEHAALSRKRVNTLRQIGLAIHTYEIARGRFPTPYFTPTGAPPADPGQALSWRVPLLPYLEHDEVLKRSDRSQPWDSSTNRPLADLVPQYADSQKLGDPMTRFRVFVGPGAVFEPGKRVKFSDFSDGNSNTVMIVEAAETGPWPQYNELPFDPVGSLPPLGRPGSDRFHVVMADGSTRWVSKDIDPAVLKALVTRAGEEKLPADW